MTLIDASPAQRADIRGFNDAMAADSSEAPLRYGSLRSPDGKDIPVPEPLYRVLVESARALIAGYQVIVAPVHHQLTTQEAADLLNMSRTYLVRLLDRGEIPSEKVGRHRRVAFGDVMTYKKRRMAERRDALVSLIQEGEETGLYERFDASK
ncbi:MAG: binding domain protein excisionase family [Candidatus Eremiobacteraeota bacterium]|nr:binding domain protein excisionase family [Candidatus Eremiobacteraeota bacterium]